MQRRRHVARYVSGQLHERIRLLIPLPRRGYQMLTQALRPPVVVVSLVHLCPRQAMPSLETLATWGNDVMLPVEQIDLAAATTYVSILRGARLPISASDAAIMVRSA